MKTDTKNLLMYTGAGLFASSIYILSSPIEMDQTKYFSMYGFTMNSYALDTLLVYFGAMMLIIIPPVYYLLSTWKKKINTM